MTGTGGAKSVRDASRRPGSKRTVLVASPQVPEADRESGSRRTFHAVGFFLELGWRVALAVRDPSRDSAGADLLRERGVEVLEGFGETTLQCLSRGAFDMAWIAFWEAAEHLMPDIRRVSPATRIVVDSVDLHFLRRCREALLAENEGDRRRFLEVDYGIDLSRELNVYASADAVVTVSEKEAALLDDFLGGSVATLCWPDGEDLPRFRAPFRERRGMLFVGSFLHAPNRDGLRWLCREVLPRMEPRLVERHPLRVVGHGADSKVEGWIREAAGAELVGWAPSLRPYWEGCRVAAVPLRFGAGTKRKLIQSALVGLPAVSTSVGVEGLGLEDGKEVLVADSAADFAARLSLALTDPVLWEKLARRGRRKVLRKHGWGLVRQRFVEAVERCLQLAPKQAGGPPPDWFERWLRNSYAVLRERVRTAVEVLVPEGAKVAVVSRGDDQLLRMGKREGWHFPRREDGVYTGFHPPDDAWATEHLRGLAERGVGFLVFPATSLWWIEHYRGFAEFLRRNCRLCFDEPETGRIYALEGLGGSSAEAKAAPAKGKRD